MASAEICGLDARKLVDLVVVVHGVRKVSLAIRMLTIACRMVHWLTGVEAFVIVRNTANHLKMVFRP